MAQVEERQEYLRARREALRDARAERRGGGGRHGVELQQCATGASPTAPSCTASSASPSSSEPSSTSPFSSQAPSCYSQASGGGGGTRACGAGADADELARKPCMSALQQQLKDSCGWHAHE